MDKILRQEQLKILKAFAQKDCGFRLAGGTALELYYLKHRFSADLDFFTNDYEDKKINDLINHFRKFTKNKIRFENEFITDRHAKVKFYLIKIENYNRPLKLDFVEEVFFKNPQIRIFDGVKVYSEKNIYAQKLMAISGSLVENDEVGKEIIKGRQVARDVFDMYLLSKKIIPLHKFLHFQPPVVKRGIVHWYRSYPRQDYKLALLDMDIYDKKFDSRVMITYLDKEIEKFIREEVL